MARRLGVGIGFTPNPEEAKEVIKRVKIAEEVGVEACFTAETWGRDQFSLLTRLAVETSKIKLGTGIAPVYGRSPAMLAMTSATLDELSGGRFILGLGTSGSRVIEHWHGEPFAKPLTRMREYIEIINMIVRGEKVIYNGEIFKLERGFKLLFDPVRKHIPINVAGISPKSMREVVGPAADAWEPVYWPKSKFIEGKETIATASVAAGRPADAVECWASIVTVIDSNLDRAKKAAAGPMTWYVTNMGDFYHQMLTRNGFGDDIARIRKAAETHKPAPFQTNDELLAVTSDRLIDETACYGDIETVAAGIEERRQLGVDMPVISMPSGTPNEIERILGTLVS